MKLLREIIPTVALCAAMSTAAWAGHSSDCSPAYRNGMQGTFRMAWNVICIAPAQPSGTENLDSCPQRWKPELKDDLIRQSVNGPVQFSWVSGAREEPAEIEILVQFREEKDGQAGATNHWGEVSATEFPKIGKKGVTLFHFKTNSYQGDDTYHSILVEASGTSYSKLANGWACGAREW